MPESLKSRKLWVALIAAFVAFGNSLFDWGLKSEEVWMVVLPLLGYLGVEGGADVVSRWQGWSKK